MESVLSRFGQIVFEIVTAVNGDNLGSLLDFQFILDSSDV